MTFFRQDPLDGCTERVRRWLLVWDAEFRDRDTEDSEILNRQVRK